MPLRVRTLPLTGEVRLSLMRAAPREHVGLLTVDNRSQPKIAVRSADYLIRERVDLAIEFQTDELIAPAIASQYMQANIPFPFIVIDIPHPGATYFGTNNYQAGLMAGHYLGRWAKKHWSDEVDEILLIELPRAGSLPKARLRGVSAGVGETFRLMEDWRTVFIDGDGQFQTTLERVRRYLYDSKIPAHPGGRSQRFQCAGRSASLPEAGRAGDCAIVGQNAQPEARAEPRTPHTRLIASVAYFPENYGDGLMR
jgi:ribose transport system substrate-binding protein